METCMHYTSFQMQASALGGQIYVVEVQIGATW